LIVSLASWARASTGRRIAAAKIKIFFMVVSA
jgi:hypothetical protein